MSLRCKRFILRFRLEIRRPSADVLVGARLTQADLCGETYGSYSWDWAYWDVGLANALPVGFVNQTPNSDADM
jgi:hypothetical protein